MRQTDPLAGRRKKKKGPLRAIVAIIAVAGLAWGLGLERYLFGPQTPPPTTEERLESAEHAVDSGQPRVAIRELEALLTEQPDHPEALRGLGELYLTLEQHKLAAIQFRRLRRLTEDPDDAAILTGLGRALAASGEIDDAAALASRLASKGRRLESLWIEAEVDVARDDLTAARQRYEQLLTIAPDKFEALVAAARLDVRAKDFEQAGTRLARAAEIRPNDPSWMWKDAELAHRQGDHLRAEARFGSLIELGAVGGPIDARIGRARAQLYLGDSATAYDALDKILAARPDHVLVNLLRAEGAFADGDYAKAETLLRVVMTRRPKHRRARLLRGASQLVLQQWADAQKSLVQFADAPALSLGRQLFDLANSGEEGGRVEDEALKRLLIRLAHPITSARQAYSKSVEPELVESGS